MLRLILVLISLMCLLTISASQDRVPPEQARVTLEARDQEARDALRSLFAKTNASYSISPEVTGKVSASLKDLPFPMALQQILRQVDAVAVVEEGIYIIAPRVSVATSRNGLSGGLNLTQVEVAQALRSVPVAERVEIAPGVAGQVTIIGDYTGEAALSEIARQVDARVERVGATYRLTPKNTLQKRVAAMRHVDADIRSLVTELMDSTGASYVISGGVVGKVTLNLEETTVQTAVESILAPIGGRIVLRQGVFVVSVR